MNDIPKLPLYHIDHLIAEGGTARVFWGIDLRSGFPVAIKELKLRHFSNQVVLDKFRNFETMLYLFLKHPNIPKLVELIDMRDKGQMYIVMEFVQGRDLEHYIYKEIGLIPENKALPIFLEILNTVAYLHNIKIPSLNIDNGILHLDIKPNNVMLMPNGKIKLLDLGIASRLGGNDNSTGYGTPAYMPPEQFEKRKCGKYTDIFALGVLLFEMLTGRQPFMANTKDELRRMLKYSPVPTMRNIYPMIGQELQYIVDRAMAKNPEHRFQTCEEFALCIKDYMKRKNIQQL